MMIDRKLQLALSESIDLLHRAVTEPRYWDLFLTKVRQQTRSHSGSLQLDILADHHVISGCFQGYDPQLLELYKEHYYQHDIWLFAAMDNPDFSRDVMISDRMVDWAAGRRSVFYNELGRLADMDYLGGMAIELDDDVCFRLTLQRDEKRGSYSDAEVCWYLRQLRPHLESALATARLVGKGGREPELAIRYIESPALLLNAERRVIARNPACESTAGLATMLSFTGESVRFPASVHEQVMADVSQACSMVDHAVALAGGRYYCRCAQGRDWLIEIRPITLDVASTILFSPPMRLALVTVRCITRQLDPGVLMNWFDLTRSETQIVAMLVEGLSVREISQASGRTEHTVRSAMKAIFLKCNVGRQAELVAAVAASPAWQ